jgi:hypothetical protein
MDRRRHSIQLSTGGGAGSAAAATQPSDDGMLSSELYLAVCGGRKEEALALLCNTTVAPALLIKSLVMFTSHAYLNTFESKYFLFCFLRANQIISFT